MKGETETHNLYGCATGESTQKLLRPSGESRKTETSPAGDQIRHIPYEAEKQENDMHSGSYGHDAIPALQKTTAVRISPVIAPALADTAGHLTEQNETAISQSIGDLSSSFQSPHKFSDNVFDNEAKLFRHPSLCTSASSHNERHMREERRYRSPDNCQLIILYTLLVYC